MTWFFEDTEETCASVVWQRELLFLILIIVDLFCRLLECEQCYRLKRGCEHFYGLISLNLIKRISGVFQAEWNFVGLAGAMPL